MLTISKIGTSEYARRLVDDIAALAADYRQRMQAPEDHLFFAELPGNPAMADVYDLVKANAPDNVHLTIRP